MLLLLAAVQCVLLAKDAAAASRKRRRAPRIRGRINVRSTWDVLHVLAILVPKQPPCGPVNSAFQPLYTAPFFSP